MSFFDLFKRKKKYELTEAQLKWNKLWELWSKEELESPISDLMTYDSEIQNGGHLQFFLNLKENGDLKQTIKELNKVLPKDLNSNLNEAYKYFCDLNIKVNTSEEYCEEEKEGYFLKNDSLYYENYNLIEDILNDYASKLSL